VFPSSAALTVGALYQLLLLWTIVTVFFFKTCREFNRIGDGLGLRVHFIHNVNDDLKKFGAKLFKKFGKLM
jgi:hypothetical protein